MYVEDESGQNTTQNRNGKNNDYLDYYNRMKIMAADKKWSDQQF